jgi:hypothetical protein
LFSLGPEHKDHLIDGSVSVELKNVFDEHGQLLSSMAATTRKDAKSWTIKDGNKEFLIEDAGMLLNKYFPFNVLPYCC